MPSYKMEYKDESRWERKEKRNRTKYIKKTTLQILYSDATKQNPMRSSVVSRSHKMLATNHSNFPAFQPDLTQNVKITKPIKCVESRSCQSEWKSIYLNKMQLTESRPDREVVTTARRKPHNEWLHELYFSPDVMWVVNFGVYHVQ
jgi:hypothetical protein